MVAGYGGDWETACAQLAPQLIQTMTVDGGSGVNACAQSQSQPASPQRQEEAESAILTAVVVGHRAGVSISSPDPAVGDPFEGNSWVHLMLIHGVWKIFCLGYCNGIKP